MIVWIIAVVILFLLYIVGLSVNPPAFYVDESGLAYNAFLVSRTGAGEFGSSFPLYFQFFTGGYVQYVSPTQVYLLAIVYLFVPPTILAARIFSAFWVFAGCILLGVLARQLSKSTIIGVVVGLTAIVTPWLFDLRGLLLEHHFMPFAIVVFLLAVRRATHKALWGWLDAGMITGGLCLITYCYTSGRGLSVILAGGLIIFVTDRSRFAGVLKTWLLYAVSLIPIFVYNFQNPGVLTSRFYQVSYIRPEIPVTKLAWMFATRFFECIDPTSLLLYGDPNARHHVPGSGGAILFATFCLMVVGLIIVVLQRRRDRWWLYIVFGLFASVIPGAITNDAFHQPRLLGCPIFLLILTVPALEWLLGDVTGRFSSSGQAADQQNFISKLIPARMYNLAAGRQLRYLCLAVLLVMTLAQTVFYQYQFRTIGVLSERQHIFDGTLPIVLDRALEQPKRPIYLQDGARGPVYIHVYWYATVRGLDLNNFVHLSEGETPPPDSIVLSSDNECSNCDVIFRDYVFFVYKTRGSEPVPETPSGSNLPEDSSGTIPDVIGSEGSEPGQFSRPRDVAIGKNGNFYVADSGNGRIQQFNSDGEFVASFDVAGGVEGQTGAPDGIAVDAIGNIFVTDAANHKLIKFGPDGKLQKEWTGGPDFGFYGPRGIAIGPDDQLYIVDQGRTRIVRFDIKKEEFTSWGKSGTGEGEFNSSVGIAVGNKNVFVTDAGNSRIQVFDLDGNFVRQWPIAAWNDRPENYPGVVFDEQTKHLYVTNGPESGVLVFDLEGNPIEEIVADGENKLDNPSGVAILETAEKRSLVVSDIRASKLFLFSFDKAKKKK